MSSRSTRRTRAVARQSVGIALAAPQVITHRLQRLARAGAAPSSADRAEFRRMVTEKQAAALASVQAMAVQSWRAGQALALSWLRAAWAIPRGGGSPAALAAQVGDAALGILAQGLAPLHHSVTGNARRLARQRTRG